MAQDESDQERSDDGRQGSGRCFRINGGVSCDEETGTRSAVGGGTNDRPSNSFATASLLQQDNDGYYDIMYADRAGSVRNRISIV